MLGQCPLIHLSTRPHICPLTHPPILPSSVCVSTLQPPTYPTSIHPSVTSILHPSTQPATHPPIYATSIHLSGSQSVHPPTCASFIHPSVYPFPHIHILHLSLIYPQGTCPSIHPPGHSGAVTLRPSPCSTSSRTLLEQRNSHSSTAPATVARNI